MNEYMTLEEAVECLAKPINWLSLAHFGEFINSEWRFVRAKVEEMKAQTVVTSNVTE